MLFDDCRQLLNLPDLDAILQDNLHFSAEKLPYLLKKKYPRLPAALLSEWVINAKKATDKLPVFAEHRCLIPSLSLEQSTSEAVASNRLYFSGATALDLTGGLGVDTYFLAQHFKEVHYIETDPALCLLAEYNFNRLGVKNITIHNDDAEKWLQKHIAQRWYDLIFLDPSRRTLDGKRVSDPDQCYPPVHPLLPMIKKMTNRLWLKTAPLFDFQEGLNRWQNIRTLNFYSFKGEMREVLYDFDFSLTEETFPTKRLCAIHPKGRFTWQTKIQENISPQEALHKQNQGNDSYLYCYDLDVVFHASRSVGDFFSECFDPLQSFLTDRNAYIISNQWIEPFAGRIFKVIQFGKADKLIKRINEDDNDEFNMNQITVISRSVALTDVAKVKKKLRLPEGDKLFLILFYGAGNVLFAVLAERCKEQG